MSGIYIPGMGFPEDPQLVVITPDGMAMMVGPEVTKLRATQAIPVPDHGDLIDRNAAIAACIASPKLYGYSDEGRKITDIYDALVAAPTVIPADLPVMYYPQVDGITPTVIPADKEAET